MKLSYRDKVIFVCAIVLIILIAGFFLFIKPKFEEMNYAKSELTAKQSEQADVQAKIDTLPDLVQQLKDKADEVAKVQEVFYDDYTYDEDLEEVRRTDPYEFEREIHTMLDDAKVTVNSMTTNYTVASEMQEYVVSPSNVIAYDLMINSDLYGDLPQSVRDAYAGSNKTSADTIVIGVTDITVGYTDNMQISNVLSFVDAVAESGKTLNVLSVSQPDSSNTTDTETSGEITIRLYSLHKLDVDQVKEESDEVEIVTETEETGDEVTE
jgi:hypothetical protein